MTTYRIIRMYRDHDLTKVMARNLSLQEAQEWCRDPETTSSKCSEETNIREETAKFGPWFDGYEEDRS